MICKETVFCKEGKISRLVLRQYKKRMLCSLFELTKVLISFKHIAVYLKMYTLSFMMFKHIHELYSFWLNVWLITNVGCVVQCCIYITCNFGVCFLWWGLLLWWVDGSWKTHPAWYIQIYFIVNNNIVIIYLPVVTTQ